MRYKPRLTTPSKSNDYYNSYKNPFVEAGYGIFQNGGNCTCYAWGRFYELIKTKPKLYTGNAETWYKHTEDGYARGQTPKLGAVICWEGLGSKAGHVAVVEEIKSDGTIVTSNSGWKKSLFYTQTLKPPYSLGSSYKLQGFIYNPNNYNGANTYTGTFPTLPSRGYFNKGDKGEQVKNVQRFLNWAINSKLAIDGSYGPATTNAVKKFQGIVGIRQDGSYGKSTQTKAKAFTK